MTKQKLKIILTNYFKESTVDALVRGSRYPSMTKAIQIFSEHSVPLNAWIDIKDWLKEEVKEGETETSTKASK